MTRLVRIRPVAVMMSAVLRVNVTFVTGEYGDIVSFGSRTYFCWYPAGKLQTSLSVDPEQPPALDEATRDRVIRETLVESLRAHHPQSDLEPVRQAFAFAVEAHGGQRRASGESYVTHPVASAQFLAELGIGPVYQRRDLKPRREHTTRKKQPRR